MSTDEGWRKDVLRLHKRRWNAEEARAPDFPRSASGRAARVVAPCVSPPSTHLKVVDRNRVVLGETPVEKPNLSVSGWARHAVAVEVQQQALVASWCGPTE